MLAWLRVKVSGFGNDSIGDGYAEDLQLQTSWNAPSPRPDYCLWRDVYEKYMHMRCTCGCSDGWVDRDLDRASLVNTECLHVEKHIHAIAAQSIFSCLIAVDVKLVLYKHPIITNQDEEVTTDQLLPHIMQVVS